MTTPDLILPANVRDAMVTHLLQLPMGGVEGVVNALRQLKPTTPPESPPVTSAPTEP